MRNDEAVAIKPARTVLPDQTVAYFIVGVIAVFFLFFLMLPLVQILKTSFVTEGQATFNNYIEYFGKARIRRSLYNSFHVAGVTTVVTTIMAFLVAFAAFLISC